MRSVGIHRFPRLKIWHIRCWNYQIFVSSAADTDVRCWTIMKRRSWRIHDLWIADLRAEMLASALSPIRIGIRHKV